MSDNEGGDDDYGDYEDIGEAGAEEEAEAGPPEGEAGPGEAEASEAGLEEDAAGSEDDEDKEEDGTEEERAEEDGEPIEPAPAGRKALPQRQKVDPLARASNKPRTTRVVAPDDRVTDNRLQKSEAANVIAMRAKQIADHATVFTDAAGLHDPVAMAYKELFDRQCPFILRRQIGVSPLGDPIVEEWAVREMTLPPLTPPVPLGAAAPVHK